MHLLLSNGVSEKFEILIFAKLSVLFDKELLSLNTIDLDLDLF